MMPRIKGSNKLATLKYVRMICGGKKTRDRAKNNLSTLLTFIPLSHCCVFQSDLTSGPVLRVCPHEHNKKGPCVTFWFDNVIISFHPGRVTHAPQSRNG